MEKKRGPGKIARWFRDVRAELRRVVWPTPKELRNLTLVVLGLSVAVGFLMWAFDTIFTRLYQLLTTLF